MPGAAEVFDFQVQAGVVRTGADGEELPGGSAVQDGVAGEFADDQGGVVGGGVPARWRMMA
jgi:hypothetical protein